jgi:hypothetical protein
MSTVTSRVIRSSPHRDTIQTWTLIVELLTQGKEGAVKSELMSVAGVAGSIIAEQAPKDAAIVVTCDGPRTRIYCLYDEDAIDGADAKEDPLGCDPLRGEWSISLPCPADDLDWVQRALKAKSTRITARDQAVTLGESEKATTSSQGLSLNVEAFLKS